MKLCKDLPRMRDSINLKVLKKENMDMVAEECAVKTIECMQDPKIGALAKHKRDKRLRLAKEADDALKAAREEEDAGGDGDGYASEINRNEKKLKCLILFY